MARVGVIGDKHVPATHPGYLSFCQDVFDAWQVDTVIDIGDHADQACASVHAPNHQLWSPYEEFEAARRDTGEWYAAFPESTVLIGNHDQRFFKRALDADIPLQALRTFNEMWETPNWRWAETTQVDDVFYIHGTGNGGINPAWNAAKKLGMSLVMGHCHSRGGVKHSCSSIRRIFGMDVGCGVDNAHPFMWYGKQMIEKPCLSCAVIVDGMPYHEMMPCGPKEKYRRSAFKHYKVPGRADQLLGV